jgi:hypothetical protein
MRSFERFDAAYPKKTARTKAEQAWLKLKPSPKLVETILAVLEKQKKSPEWTKERGQFVPHPASYVNARRWEDEVQQDAPDADPYAGWPVLVDCTKCGGAHAEGETCPK